LEKEKDKKIFLILMKGITKEIVEICNFAFVSDISQTEKSIFDLNIDKRFEAAFLNHETCLCMQRSKFSFFFFVVCVSFAFLKGKK